MPAAMGIYPESRVLRSRTRTGDSTDWWSPEINRPIGREDSFGVERRIIQVSRFRVRSTRIRLFFVSVVIFLVFCGYMRFIRVAAIMYSGRLANGETQKQTEANIPNEVKTYDLAVRPSSPSDGPLRAAPKRAWRYPLVDRTILEKLDRMQEFFTEDYSLLPMAAEPAADLRFRWPPIVTRIPERTYRPSGGSSNGFKPDGSSAICESVKHSRPCRFLLPLRISEQESKARVHFSQIALLARRLNRTLVLPNVGKSKIGACFKWPFAAYYDSTSLIDDEAVGAEYFVDMESFRAWVDNRDRQRKEPLKSQLISIAPALPPGAALRKVAIHSNENISLHAYSTFGAWERDLPGCFSGRFDQLRLETRPIFMSAPSQVKRNGVREPIGNSIVKGLSAISPGPLREPPVLVVNWDLRYPVFDPAPKDRPLQYSPRMHDLALKYAPKDPYLVVQWRMETVDLEFLPECAHALVDVLGRVLHDHALAENVTTVWFASDYPYPIASQPNARSVVVAAKSGTFKDFEVRHEEAVEILREAFDEQGELKKWKLTDFAESMGGDSKSQSELLQDPGVLGILDKIISIKADLFVSGSTRCSRKSSFTKQVVDARNERSGRSQFHLRNVVDIFG